MQDVQKELMESAKLLEDPKYKAELEAIAGKMKALDAKFKANIKFEKWRFESFINTFLKR